MLGFLHGEDLDFIGFTSLIRNDLELHSFFQAEHVSEDALESAFTFVRKTSTSSEVIHEDLRLVNDEKTPERLYEWVREE